VTTSPYSGHIAALTTRHGKQDAIAPAFRECLGLEIVITDIDTDTFGTFAGEVPRLDTPLNTAVAKARAGLAASGLPLGLASEGTIGADPQLPFVTSDLEIIVFIDAQRDIVVSEWVRSTKVLAFRESVLPDQDLDALTERADFPRHGLIVRSHEGAGGLIAKGITNKVDLEEAIEKCFAQSGIAIVESDFRAHFSPTRMETIAACATKLAKRVATLCPTCSYPGWGVIEPARGLPCSACGSCIESAIRADRYGCTSCPATHEIARREQRVDPRWCPLCNP
jgi:hypothetical protein